MGYKLLVGDCRDILPTLPAESVHCCMTSPPYWGLRDYGVTGQIGLEPTIDQFVAEMVAVFREVRRVLRKDGTLWLNLGDSYASRSAADGLKPKDLCGIPWRVAFALQADGWWLRQDIIWSKPNPMPESVTDRCTKAHEYVFLLTKAERYYYDAEAIKEDAIHAGRVVEYDGTQKNSTAAAEQRMRTRIDQNVTVGSSRNKRSVWEVATAPFSEAHFATFPPALIEPCIKAGCPKGGTVLDPFGGAGTTGLVADRLQRNAILIELNPKYAEMANRCIHDDAPLFA